MQLKKVEKEMGKNMRISSLIVSLVINIVMGYVPQNEICWSPNPEGLRMWSYLEMFGNGITADVLKTEVIME